jgi:hypothetical protein
MPASTYSLRIRYFEVTYVELRPGVESLYFFDVARERGAISGAMRSPNLSTRFSTSSASKRSVF